MNWRSDFVGPLPSGTVINLQLFTDSEHNNFIQSYIKPTTITSGLLQLNDPSNTLNSGTSQFAVNEGGTVHMLMTLTEPGNVVIDSNQDDTATWSLAQLATTVQEHAGTGGGLTDEQSLQLSQTNAATFPSQLVDNLTLQTVPLGPDGNVTGHALTAWVFAVIVRITGLSDAFTPLEPDEDYFVPTLATVRITRGNDLWQRTPIHTTTKIVRLDGEGIIAAVSATTGALWLLAMTLDVKFRPGVTGTVHLMNTP